jgi:adenosylcobinamide-GDP ribazoletransferase
MRREGQTMTASGEWLRGLAADIEISILFSTRFRLERATPVTGQDIARASWAWPIAGVLVGLVGALAYWIAAAVNLPPFVAASLALTATLIATGCLHEDGLADAADGLGGASRERKLDIMRDSRIGTYGVCALVLSLLLRVGALASLPNAGRVALALIAAHGAARALMPAFMRAVPPARLDGLAAEAGRPPRDSVTVAAVLGLALLLLGLGIKAGPIALLLLIVTFAVMRHLSMKAVGGQTGDVTGALEQVGEIVVLLSAAAI